MPSDSASIEVWRARGWAFFGYRRVSRVALVRHFRDSHVTMSAPLAALWPVVVQRFVLGFRRVAAAENSSSRVAPVTVRRVRCLGEAAFIGAATLLGGVFWTAQASADPMSTSPEQAFDLGEIPSPRALGMGGALNALGVSTASIYLNPANMAMARVYHLEGIAAYSPQAQRQTYGLAIVDSLLSSTRLAGGLAGAWSQIDPNGINRSWTDVRGGLALPFGDHIAVGAVLRWLRIEQTAGTSPFGSSLAASGTSSSPIFNSVTVDVGATASLGDFRFALVGHNLTVPNTGLAPTTGVAGVGFVSGAVALEADGQLDFTTWGSARARLMGGGELFLFDRYAVRAGWRYDSGTQINSPSLGVGYIDPTWSVELGVRHDLIGDHAETLGVISLRYFYDPTGTTQSVSDPGGF
jgi:hypothetical protein